MTLAGLNTINLSAINTFQQFILFLLIILGSAILVSIVVVHTRRKAFERRFKSVLEQKRRSRNFMRRVSFNRSHTRVESRNSTELGIGTVRHSGGGISQEKPSPGDAPMEPTELHTLSMYEDAETAVHEEDGPKSLGSPVSLQGSEMREVAPNSPLSVDPQTSRRITFASTTSPTRHRQHSPIFSMQGVGARGDISNYPKRSRGSSNELSRVSENDRSETEIDSHNVYGRLSGVLVGRNSQFSNLNLAERVELGGVEYRAVTILAVIVPLYFILWQLLGCIGLGAYVAMNRQDATRVNDENPW